MTSDAVPRRRPRTWLLVVGAVVALIGVHALWDYLEARRIMSAIAAVARAGGSINLDRIEPHLLPGAYETAGPYYVAAATLAAAGRPLPLIAVAKTPTFSGVRGPHEIQAWYTTRDIPSATLEQTRLELERRADALHVLDMASARPFEGFSSELPYWQVYAFEGLHRLCGVRTAYAAATGDRELAIRSLRAELGLFSIDIGLTNAWPSRRLLLSTIELSLMLNDDGLSVGDLETLADAFARMDDDTELWRSLDTQRASYIATFLRNAAYERVPYGVPKFVVGFSEASVFLRPLSAHRLQRRLDVYDELTDASRLPWPERLDQLRAVAIRRGWHDDGGLLVTRGWSNDPWGFIAQPLDLASVRVARTAIAIERYRRANQDALPATVDALVPAYLPSIPIDPYSGQPIHYDHLADGYQVYSVSFDRKDDGGDLMKDLPVIRVTRR
ncbi:MAG TPA: hypothetical protein VHB78_17950 [Vicinamibacterales bacterium]|jgi:hypothetical protein|nr:hypothetical protein [Vicinamibacterales bacterium]